MSNPTISVIMSVYNTPKEYIKEAIESILNQTYRDFEFLIINDHSNEETTNYLYTFNDPRILIINNDTNLGLTKSLNKALKIAKGDYIARMDSDDIAYPNRFEKQLDYIKKHPEYIAIGSDFILSNTQQRVTKANMPKEVRRARMFFYNEGLCHPTAFINSTLLKKHNITYNEEVLKAQDYALWVDILKYGDIGNINEPLLTYRIHDKQITKAFSNQMSYEQMTMKKQLDSFNHHFNDQEIDLYYHIYRGEITSNEKIAANFMKTIIELNNQKQIYDPTIFKKEAKKVWIKGSLKQIKKHHRAAMLIHSLF